MLQTTNQVGKCPSFSLQPTIGDVIISLKTNVMVKIPRTGHGNQPHGPTEAIYSGKMTEHEDKQPNFGT